MVSVSTFLVCLEKRNGKIFTFAGIMVFSYALLKGLKTFAGLGVITVIDVMWGAFVLLVPGIALLGLYPRLRQAAPRSSAAAVVVSVIAGLAIVAIQVQLILTTLTMEGYPEIPGDVPTWPVFATYLVFVMLALGFLFSSVAARRNDTVPRTVAGLLVIPFLGWIGFVVAPFVLFSGDHLGLLVHLPISGVLLAIGYYLEAEGEPTGRPQPAPESTAR